MQSTNVTAATKAHRGMKEWGRKARKAEARTKRRATKVAAIREARES